MPPSFLPWTHANTDLAANDPKLSWRTATTTRSMHWSAASWVTRNPGVHNGLPVTVIVSTTLQELAAGAGRAMTEKSAA